MVKLPNYHFSWIVSFQKLRYYICEILPLETIYIYIYISQEDTFPPLACAYVFDELRVKVQTVTKEK